MAPSYLQPGLILSQNHLDGYSYINLGRSLAEELKDEDLSSIYLPLKAWDTIKAILNEGTKEGVLAIENFAILFEPTLKINLKAFLKEAMTGRSLILKLDYPVSKDWFYYPFPGDHSYYLDLSDINTITR